uniref:Uncharacterized protein n=1 Tax=Rhizobium rhizogenes TaxID=359 RepID=A0A7S4ZT18_RHIRH|nr:hypothetical protein [Rhizobium rhizogenes]QCL09229.1 hypothetical protein pC5.7b_362 [Rhizobium rhizogenes]QCL09861.1 hypothetical protein pC5.8b_371 [Rhizobium rhizogenes]
MKGLLIGYAFADWPAIRKAFDGSLDRIDNDVSATGQDRYFDWRERRDVRVIHKVLPS